MTAQNKEILKLLPEKKEVDCNCVAFEICNCCRHFEGRKEYNSGITDSAKKLSEAEATIEDIVKALDCLGYFGLGTKLTDKEIQVVRLSLQEKFIFLKRETNP